MNRLVIIGKGFDLAHGMETRYADFIETVTNCNAFKLQAPDGKMRLTDVADTEQLFRLIQYPKQSRSNNNRLWLKYTTFKGE